MGSVKMVVATDEPKNPIKQDTKKGKLRFYPYNINWNYGLIPQTWEDPGVENADLKVMGDNDPVDVVEIGSATLEMGGVYPVKIVGVLAMIDDGELDWKMIAVNSKDPKFASVNDVADVEREFPGEIQKILEWFRDYKIPDGKPARPSATTTSACPPSSRWRSWTRPTSSTTSSSRASARTRRSWPWSKAVGLDPASPPPPPEIIIQKKKHFFHK